MRCFAKNSNWRPRDSFKRKNNDAYMLIRGYGVREKLMRDEIDKQGSF